VILVGGGSRVPKVQEILTQFVGRELGKNLNTDESAAMGAVYKAADLSSGFKVKKFITKVKLRIIFSIFSLIYSFLLSSFILFLFSTIFNPLISNLCL